MEKVLNIFFDKINDLESRIDELSEDEMRELLKNMYAETSYYINNAGERVYHD